MNFYFLDVAFRTFKKKPKSEIGLTSATKVFKEVLSQLNVTYKDPCCPDPTPNVAPVRYNITTSTLEYLSDPETGEYTDVPLA